MTEPGEIRNRVAIVDGVRIAFAKSRRDLEALRPAPLLVEAARSGEGLETGEQP